MVGKLVEMLGKVVKRLLLALLHMPLLTLLMRTSAATAAYGATGTTGAAVEGYETSWATGYASATGG